MTNYPRNCWYVAATSEEVNREPLGRRLLDLDVVLYRTQSGEVVALADRCAHRAHPLSIGRLDGDRIVCGYHGFAYDQNGACVHIPSQSNVPAGTCVTAYPVREQQPSVWIWLGRPSAANLSRLPRTPWLADPGWGSFGSRRHVDANYMLLHEHYLDFTHIFEVHAEEAPITAEALPPLDEIEVAETSVSYTRTIPAAVLADWEAEATGLDRAREYARRESGRFVSPALHVQHWAIDGDDGRTDTNVRVQAFTPETPTSTHVFLHGAHDYAYDRTVVTRHLEAMLNGLADRDVELLQRIQSRAGVDAFNRGVRVRSDGAALKARRTSPRCSGRNTIARMAAHPTIDPLITKVSAHLASHSETIAADLLARVVHEIPSMGRDDQEVARFALAMAKTTLESFAGMLEHGAPADEVEMPWLATKYVRRLAWEGITVDEVVRGYRLAHESLFEYVTTLVAAQESSRADLARFYADFGSASFRYLDVLCTRISAAFAAEREAMLRGELARRGGVIGDLLAGVRLDAQAAERTLGYRLHGPHVALLAWPHDPTASPDASALDDAVAMIADASGATAKLLLHEAPDLLAAWLTIAGADTQPSDVEDALRDAGVVVACGHALTGVEGFRESRRQADRARLVAVAGGGCNRLVRYQDNGLASLSSMTWMPRARSRGRSWVP